MKSFISEPKEIMSDSLKEHISDEELVKAYSDLFVSVVLESAITEGSLMGSLIGLELSESLKLDFKVPIDEAFLFLKNIVAIPEYKKIVSVILTLHDDYTKIEGPFEILSTKIVELDQRNKICVLAVDLINKPA